MIEILAIVVLALCACAWAAAPLVRGPRRDLPETSRLAEEVDARKRAAFDALLDIEGERAIGKLSEADFDALRREYEAEALAALKELDALGAYGGDDELEAEIAALRNQLECPRCGGARDSAGVCVRCGATA